MSKPQIQDAYPLAPMQQGMLFHSVYTAGTGLYVEQCICTLEGKLQLAAFQQAWQQVVDRHSILRTAFVWESGKSPIQVVMSAVKLGLEQQQWLDADSSEQEERLSAFLKAESARGFELTRAPLMRLNLFQIAEERYQFVWSFHHLLLDGWSYALILREVFRLYSGLCRGKTIQLPQPRPYREYIAWLQRRSQPAAERFWRSWLAGYTAPVSLKVDRAAAMVDDGAHYRADQQIALAPAATAALQTFARQQQLPLNTLAQAAWAILLSRYSGEDDIVFGVTTSGRPSALPGIEAMVGMFINTLPMRLRIAPNAPLLPWLKPIPAQHSAMCQYEYAPLVQIQTWSEVPRGTPLFESLLVFENYPAGSDLVEPGAPITISQIRGIERSNYPLALVIVPGSRLSLQITYDYRRFDAATITRMLGHLQMLLEGMIAGADQPIGALPLLTPAERHQLLVEWNTPGTTPPTELGVHQLFEAQAARSPDALAIECDGAWLTYRDLNQRANHWAQTLRTMGVGPEVLVGVYCERSLDAIVGLLSILKAGGAYLPLDPAYPGERIAFMLADTQAPVVLTQRPLAARLAGHNVELVCLDEEPGADAMAQNLPSRTSPHNLAYLIYTSGSTGRPKGVGISHQAAANHLLNIQAVFELTAADRVLQFATLSFDVSLEQILATLLCGATLVLRGPDLWSVADFARRLQETQLTVVNLPPAYWNQLAHQWKTEANGLDGSTVRLVIVGGDVLPLETIRLWQQLPLRHARLLNAYGPTETTITAACHTVADLSVENDQIQRIPIGRPIGRRVMYIRDRAGALVPIGVPGELYIGGDLLARGYHRRPDLTAERFVPDPFATTTDDRRPTTDDREPANDSRRPTTENQPSWLENQGLKIEDGFVDVSEMRSSILHPPSSNGVGGPWSVVGGRLYRTGDLARRLPDGTIEFLGRVDHQVKIRGFRIELGEIEAALAQHPAIREVAVLSDVVGAGMDRQLIAYIVASPGTTLESGALRSFLQSRLPSYMIPAIFVSLDALPINQSGKVDRHRLTPPEQHQRQEESPYIAARSEPEALLVKIWSEVLGRAQVSIHDNFFALGGDSILSIQVVARSNQAGLRLTPKLIFAHPTIAELAAAAVALAPARVQRGATAGTLPLTPIQHWFFEQRFAEQQHFNQAFLLELRERIAPAEMERIVQALIAHHEALRLRFTWDERALGWVQRYAEREQPVPFALVDLSALPGAGQHQVIEAAAARYQASLDLANGPLMRAVLFELGPAQAPRLLLVVHHLAVDGISWRILLDDLRQIYGQLRGGEPIALPERTTSFKYWAERLVAYGQSAALRQESAFWLAEPFQRSSKLPLDHPGGANTEALAGDVWVALSVEETQVLLHEVPAAHHAQINDLLLTALLQAFVAWTGAPALRIDLEGHGREALFDDVDISRTVGWFTTIFPMVLEAGGARSPEALLKAVKEQLRQIPNKGIGYGVLRYLCRDRALVEQLQAQPPAQVSFNYLGQFDQDQASPAFCRLVHEPSGPSAGPRNLRPYLLEINGLVVDGQLRVNWRYGTEVHCQATVAALAERFIEALRRLISSSQVQGSASLSPSDFPEAGLNQEELDDLIAELI